MATDWLSGPFHQIARRVLAAQGSQRNRPPSRWLPDLSDAGSVNRLNT